LQPLPLGVAERQDRPTRALLDALMRDAKLVEAQRPPVERGAIRRAQQNRGDGSRAATGGASVGPVEEGQLGTRVSDLIAIEEMVRRDIVWVDGLLAQPHAQSLRVERDVARRVTSDGGDVVQPADPHILCSRGFYLAHRSRLESSSPTSARN